MFKKREKNYYLLELWNGHFVIIENIKINIKRATDHTIFSFYNKKSK